MSNIEKVVEGGYCVGCGACAFVNSNPMQINKYGEYVPELSPGLSLSEKANFVCPSLNPQQNEEKLAIQFLPDNPHQSKMIGPYASVRGGFVTEGNFRALGTSGGFGTWIGVELMKKELITGVIHVKEAVRSGVNDPFFKYGISSSIQEIRDGARTKYHVVEISEILHLVKKTEGKFLFVGLPCMVKAIRRIQMVDKEIAEKIVFTVGIVCGHLKTINWTLSLGWGKNILPQTLTKFQYRTKDEQISARAYVFTAFFNKDSKVEKIMEDSGNVVGGKFNQGALMLPACNFCDDMVGETADLTIGDAWLPRYEIDSNGTNLLIVRNQTIERILNSAIAENRLKLDYLTEKDAIYAQAGGFRQRKEGLSHRLSETDKLKIWRPVKRVESNEYTPPLLRKIIYNSRKSVTDRSRLLFVEALESGNYNKYKESLQVQLKILRGLEILSSISRIVRKKIAYVILKRKQSKSTQ